MNYAKKYALLEAPLKAIAEAAADRRLLCADGGGVLDELAGLEGGPGGMIECHPGANVADGGDMGPRRGHPIEAVLRERLAVHADT